MGEHTGTATILEVAQHYLTLGWKPVPVSYGSKAPLLPGWQHLRVAKSDLAQYFCHTSNIGLLLGKP